MPNSSPIYLEVEDIFAVGAEQQSRRKSTAKEPQNYTNRAITTFVEAVSLMNQAVLVPNKLKDIELRECDITSFMPHNSDLYSIYQMLNNVKHDLFSTSKYHSAFLPSGGNSGQNSGRVSPTGSLSRRSSGMYGGGASPVGTPTSPSGNGNSFVSSRTLMPPNSLLIERKLSSSSSLNGDISPEQLMSPQSNGNFGNSNGNGAMYLSPTSPSPVPLSRNNSLNSLMAALGTGFEDSEEPTSQLTACFMYHLNSLYAILGHFTRAANYITKRYKEETEDLY